ncbi:hypothetical protein [Paenibacillus polymyxa]|uniref:hypothetical protein n=1 Tax=Paenibacillus polymyxa TaxID=1406 RepID=UPI0032AEC44F
MSEDKAKLRKGILVSFEENFMNHSQNERSNYQKRMDEFVSRQEKLCWSKSNIAFCHNCNSDKVLYQKLDFPLITNNKRFKSVKLIGAVCSRCGEEYINGQEVRHIEETVKLINSYCSEENNDVEPSVSYCDVCESNNFNNVDLEVFLISINSKIISIAIQEDYCKECNAVFYADESDQLAMQHLRYFFLTV